MIDCKKWVWHKYRSFFQTSVLILLALFSMSFNNSSLAAVTHKTSKPYAAPPLLGITAWLNSQPLNLNNLKGKVVLIDLWSYQCPNCLHSLPYVTNWYEKYAKQGLIIIGVHVPLKQGKNIETVKRVLKDQKIEYPVAVDNNLAVVRSFRAHQLPSFYLIDKNGQVVYSSVGNGNYAIIERNIRALLK